MKTKIIICYLALLLVILPLASAQQTSSAATPPISILSGIPNDLTPDQ